MKTVCEKDKCAGCMACVDVCPRQAVHIRDDLRAYNAEIDEQRCVSCGACTRVCQNFHKPAFSEPAAWYQGWAADPEVRSLGSSGGVATAISLAFVEQGGVVCSCAFENGVFGFRTAETSRQVLEFAGSKYIKSDPSGIYRQLDQLLKKGRQVLFIGLPCQVAAAKQYVRESLRENLFTVDLICHGSPSPRLLDTFLQQYGRSLKDMQKPSFRCKSSFRLADNDEPIMPRGVRDRYLIAFLNTLNYTENCYSCLYARKERISDLTLGDAWGSTLPEEQVRKGISLVLCQTDKGRRLLERSGLYLTDIDAEQAVANNHQLREPSERPAGREAFFTGIADGKKFNALVSKSFPKQCFRQDVKTVLARLGWRGK